MVHCVLTVVVPPLVCMAWGASKCSKEHLRWCVELAVCLLMLRVCVPVRARLRKLREVHLALCLCWLLLCAGASGGVPVQRG